jgi:hypothetical protein
MPGRLRAMQHSNLCLFPYSHTFLEMLCKNVI